MSRRQHNAHDRYPREPKAMHAPSARLDGVEAASRVTTSSQPHAVQPSKVATSRNVSTSSSRVRTSSEARATQPTQCYRLPAHLAAQGGIKHEAHDPVSVVVSCPEGASTAILIGCRGGNRSTISRGCRVKARFARSSEAVPACCSFVAASFSARVCSSRITSASVPLFFSESTCRASIAAPAHVLVWDPGTRLSRCKVLFF